MPQFRNFRFRDAKFVDQQVMREVGLNLAVRITNRTLSGKDESNRNFAPYSESYRRRKATYGSSHPDLHVTGAMLDNLQPTQVTSNRVRVGFTDPDMEELARHHQFGTKRMPARPFMGIPRTWVQDIIRTIKQRMKI